jgi:hypothetical protein
MYTETRSRDNPYRAEAISITYSERANVVLLIEHIMRMRRIVSSVLCPALQYFSILCPERHDFRKGKK